MNVRVKRGDIRRGLLAGVSATALLASVYMAPGAAKAGEEEGRPTVWLELGAQVDHVDAGLQRFAPPFVSLNEGNGFTSASAAQKPPRYAVGGEGKIIFAPEDTTWVFSAALRYGRSNKARSTHEETHPASATGLISVPLFGKYSRYTVPPVAKRFADTTMRQKESYLIADFQAGKDVGLGLFGSGGMSTFGFGVRVAQFSSRSNVALGADPDFAIAYVSATQLAGFPADMKEVHQNWHVYTAIKDAASNFRGGGPSLAWDASAPLAGNSEAGEMTFDWGVNAAVLFGRQKAITRHETSGSLQHQTGKPQHNVALPLTYHQPYHDTRSRSVIVPNLGGFAGFSFKFPNAQISVGYRADFFFGAMDGGIDARKTYDRNFHGPFARISIGLGG
jgi:hypothetical protein